MKNIWNTSGHSLLLNKNSKDKSLELSSQFLKSYLTRPELALSNESCEGEVKLHNDFKKKPLDSIKSIKNYNIKDKDTVYNWEAFKIFCDHLKRNSYKVIPSYINAFKYNNIAPLFIDHLTHIVSKEILWSINDCLIMRSAELFFRSQKILNKEDILYSVDEDVYNIKSKYYETKPLDKLFLENDKDIVDAGFIIIKEGDMENYIPYSDTFDTALDVTFSHSGLDALCRAMEMWINYFHNTICKIYPVQKINDPKWSWHTGLDKISSGILNDLYNSKNVSDIRIQNFISLFRLELSNNFPVSKHMKGKPIYLGLATDENKIFKLKPQNLIFNLPLTKKYKESLIDK